MSATETTTSRASYEFLAVKPPIHPTYDLKNVIQLALAEDAGNQGLCLNFLERALHRLSCFPLNSTILEMHIN